MIIHVDERKMLETKALLEDLEFLQHFGVKGMQWGVRKKEDRIVRKERKAAETKAERESKAKKYEDRAASYQSQLDVLNAKKTNFFNRGRIEDKKAEITKQRDQAKKDAELKRQGKLSSGQKRIVKGAVAVAAIVATYATYQSIQSGQANRMIIKGKAFITGKKAGEWKKNAELSRQGMDPEEIMSKVVQHINPDYGTPGTKVNCRRCTFAYEMRRRGNDVAATRTTTGRGQTSVGLYNALAPDKDFVGPGKTGIIKKVVLDSKKAQAKGLNPEEAPFVKAMKELGTVGKIPVLADGDVTVGIFNTLAKQPEGSRGELGVLYGPGGGHSMAYEIIRGKAHIFDTQSGTHYSDLESFQKDFGAVLHSAALTRLDNLPINNEFMMRWLKDA